MANEVKRMVEEFIKSTDQVEISVDDILEQYPEFDPDRNRVDILAALRMLENDKLGALAVGRRGKKTRFIKGAMRIKSSIDENRFNILKSIIENMSDQQELVLEANDSLTIHGGVVYDNDKRMRVIDYLKTFEENGLGVFIIGRRGGMSRFIKGGTRNSIKNKTFVIEEQVEPIQNFSKKYNLVNDVIFQHENGKYNSINDVLNAAGVMCNDEEKNGVQKELEALGYYALTTIDN